MTIEPPISSAPSPRATDMALQAYLLGQVHFDELLAWQRRLAYTVSGDRKSAYLILCEHPAVITVGRQGSRAHVRIEEPELQLRGWRIRWVNRGGGVMLHVPGQLAVYPILPLDRLEMRLGEYLERLQLAVADVLGDFSVRTEREPGRSGLWVNRRPIATFGVAVRDWVSYYGCTINISPDLELFRRFSCGGPAETQMTSLARERRGPLRPALVRERFLEHFATRFGFARTSLFFDHPALSKKAQSDALAASR